MNRRFNGNRVVQRLLQRGRSNSVVRDESIHRTLSFLILPNRFQPPHYLDITAALPSKSERSCSASVMKIVAKGGEKEGAVLDAMSTSPHEV